MTVPMRSSKLQEIYHDVVQVDDRFGRKASATSSSSYDSGYGSSRSSRRTTARGGHNHQLFAEPGLSGLLRQVFRRAHLTVETATTGEGEIMREVDGEFEGPRRTTLGSWRVWKALDLLKLGGAASRSNLHGKSEIVVVGGSTRPADPGLAVFPAHQAQDAATASLQHVNMTSNIVSSDEDLTAGYDSDLTDSNESSSSGRTWSLASMTRAMESPGHTTSLLLTQYQARLVDNLISEFLSLINSEGLVAISRTGSTESSTKSNPSSSISNNGTTGSESPRNDGRKRSRDHDGDGSNQDQGDEPPKVQRVLSPSPIATPRRLACPYYRHNPTHNLKYRSCAGPGWASVHRVKEHVYRRHSALIRCARCGDVFEEDSALQDHYRLPERCEIQVGGLEPEGLTKEQEKALRKRKKLVSEEEKWRDMYRIIFPATGGDDRDINDEIPSPYYDDGPAQFADEFQRYELYLHRELPQLVRRRLEQAVSGFTTPLENQLRAQLVDIVRSSQSELFRSYRTTATISGSGVRMESELSPLLTSPPPLLPGRVPGLDENLAHLPNEAAPQDFDAQFFDFSSMADISAYGEPPVMDEDLARLNSAELSSWAAQAPAPDLNGHFVFSDSGYGSNANGGYCYEDVGGDGDKGKEVDQLGFLG